MLAYLGVLVAGGMSAAGRCLVGFFFGARGRRC